MDNLRDIAVCPCLALDTGKRAGDDGLARDLPDAQIVLGVADVIKAPFTIMTNQQIAFAMRRQVGYTVRGPHLIEQLQMCRDPVGEGFVGGGGQNDASTGLSLGLDVIDDIRVEGQ